MNTNKIIRHYAKCTCIAEMMQKVSNRMGEHRADIYAWNSCKDPFHYIKLAYSRAEILGRIEWDQKVLDRLTDYLANIEAARVYEALSRGENILHNQTTA